MDGAACPSGDELEDGVPAGKWAYVVVTGQVCCSLIHHVMVTVLLLAQTPLGQVPLQPEQLKVGVAIARCLQ